MWKGNSSVYVKNFLILLSSKENINESTKGKENDKEIRTFMYKGRPIRKKEVILFERNRKKYLVQFTTIKESQ